MQMPMYDDAGVQLVARSRCSCRLRFQQKEFPWQPADAGKHLTHLNLTSLVDMSSSSNSEIGASAAAVLSVQPVTPSIDFTSEWLDEDGRVCAKNVDYATQCPKGHSLVPFSIYSSSAAAQAQQRLLCRICHESAERDHVSPSPGWFLCCVVGCCGGYAVCGSCVSALSGVLPAAASSDDVPVLVSFQHNQCCNRCFDAS